MKLRRPSISEMLLSASPWALLIIVLSVIDAGVANDVLAHFNNEPPYRIKFSNNTGTKVACSAAGSPSLVITWITVDGATVGNIPGLRQITSPGTLVFPPFRAEEYRQDVHAVVYKCRASNAEVVLISREVHVEAIMSQPYEPQVYDAFPLKGNTAVLKCHLPPFIGSHVVVSAWIKDNVVKIDASAKDDSKYAISSKDELFIMDVSANDVSSTFRCQTVDQLTGENRLSSTAGRLFMSEPKGNVSPRIVDGTTSIIAAEGNEIIIPCVSQGFPTPSLSWYTKSSNGQLLSLFMGDRIIKSKISIIIPKARISDSGTYICIAENLVSSEKKEINVTVMAPITVEVIPKKIKLDGNKAIHLHCVVNGGPITSISWMRNGQHFHTDQLTDTIRVQESGTYQCFAKNDHEMIHDSAQVTAGDKAPEITNKFLSKAVHSGEDVNLQCTVTGNPLPVEKWFLDEQPLPISRRYFTESQNEALDRKAAILRINDIRVEDGGLYSCSFSNKIGDTKHLNRINVYGPIGVRNAIKMTAIAGGDTLLTCPYYGYPIERITWFKESTELPNGPRHFVQGNESLVITKVRRNLDDGTYTCVVHDRKGGTTRQDVEITVMIAPKIMPFSFQEELLREGMRARLQCVVSEGDSPITIHWLKDNGNIPPDLGINIRHLDEFSSILTIGNVSPKHNGNYTCKATNAAAVTMNSAKLSVNVAPKIIPFSFQDKYVTEGRQARVLCGLVEGDPPVEFLWSKDGQALIASDVTIRSVDDYSSILSIPYINQKHSGNYTCIASNHAARAQFTAELIVNVPPKIVPFTFQDEHLLDGMLVRVSCVVSRGDLPLTISWLKDGRDIPAELSVVVRDFDEYSSVLSIDPVSVRHNGNYSCKASNSAGFITYTASLSVKVPPKWIVEPNDTSIVLGKDVTLPCSTTGHPKPTISWLKVEGHFRNTRIPIINGPDMTVLPNGSLLIYSAKEYHQGSYLCQSENGIEILGKMIFLKIHTPPVFDKSVIYDHVRRGDKLVLVCKARGDNPMHYTWRVHGAVIHDDKTSRYKLRNFVDNNISVSELIFEQSEKKDSTAFHCSARNTFGNDKLVIHITVKDVPDAPKDLKISSMSNRTVIVAWAHQGDNGSPVKHYVVHYKHIRGNWKNVLTNVTVDGKTTEAKISGLRPSQKYNVRVAAQNDIGYSVPSEEIEVTVAEEAPSAPPEDISVIAPDINSLKVMWKPPGKEHWNGIIRGYYVGYKLAEAIKDDYIFRLLEVPEDFTEVLSLPLTDLVQFTRYSVVVQAFNDGGKGPFSKEVVAITSESIPTKPPQELRCSVLTSTSIHVTWQPPPNTTVHGVLQGYKLIYKPVMHDVTKSRRKHELKSTSSTKMTLQKLQKYTNYSIEVLAYTKKGDGVKSVPIYCRTLEDIPESPSEIKALPASQESVLLSWKPPEHPNGAILSYTIYAKDNGDNIIKNSVRGNTTFFEVGGLSKGDVYEFWVTAFTVVGEGQRSRIVMQSAGTDKIAAKLASFDAEILAPADRDVMLPCKAVGIPEPSKKWITTGVRLHVLSDGSLLIKDVHPEDSDNYTCHVENERGDDLVTYSVIIQTPPDAVVLDVSLTTTTTTEVQWKAKNNGGSTILGYKLFYKNEQSSWQVIQLDSTTESYHLDGLQCGTTYQLYMIATNHLGDGKPTNVVTTSTKGGAPAVPSKESLLEEGSTFVTINLQKWQVDSCPIKYFVLEYKKMTAAQWRLFGDDVKPDRSKLVLSDLAPATWYQLRMIAHSNAGPSAGEYTFATLTRDGATIEPAVVPIAAPTNPLSYLTDIRFILAGTTALLLVLFATVAVLCFCNRKSPKRKHRRRHGSHSSHRKSSRPRSSDQDDYVEGSFTYVGGPVKGSSKDKRHKSKNELTPYATAHLSDFKGKSDRNVTPQTKSVYPQISRPTSSLADSSCPSSSELLSFRNHVQQIPTAPPMSESYCGVPAAFYSHVNKGDHQVPATPSRRFKDNMPPLPPIPNTPGRKLVTERFVRAGDVPEAPDETFVFPPPPPPSGDAESNVEAQIKVDTNYDAPWDVKGTQP